MFEDESPDLFRLNVLLKKGYHINNASDLEAMWLDHPQFKEFDVILHPGGLITSQGSSPIGSEEPIRIHKEEDKKFIKFVQDLPSLSFLYRHVPMRHPAMMSLMGVALVIFIIPGILWFLLKVLAFLFATVVAR